jgi:hypothetical protein
MMHNVIITLFWERLKYLLYTLCLTAVKIARLLSCFWNSFRFSKTIWRSPKVLMMFWAEGLGHNRILAGCYTSISGPSIPTTPTPANPADQRRWEAAAAGIVPNSQQQWVAIEIDAMQCAKGKLVSFPPSVTVPCPLYLLDLMCKGCEFVMHLVIFKSRCCYNV